jgi:hypothetical protein
VEAVIRESDGRLANANCADARAPVEAWLAAADAVLDQAEASGLLTSKATDTRRQIRRRRAFVEDACAPGGK